MLQGIKARKEEHPEPPRVGKPQPQLSQYNRYDQERFNRQNEEIEGFKIDTLGTHHGMSLKSVTEGSLAQRKAHANIPHGATPGAGAASARAAPKDLLPTAQARQLPANGPQKRPSQTPIIIVPSANTSLITMLNVKEILQELRFMSTSELLLQRKRNNQTVSYRVVDNPIKLTLPDWQQSKKSQNAKVKEKDDEDCRNIRPTKDAAEK